MDLQEEYFIRNSVRSPLIRYTGGNLLLRSRKETNICNKWRVLNISYFNKEGDPGRFELKELTPTYNSFKGRSIFTVKYNDKEDQCFWESYENHIKQWANEYKSKNYVAVTERTDILMGCWEMLLFCYDACVAEIPYSVQEAYHGVFDDSWSKNQKHEILLRCLDSLSNVPDFAGASSKYLLQGWCFLRDYVDPRRYAYWLAKLIGE